jgi:hypothetical protein
MGAQALLVECLLSGFFAIACFRARAKSTDMRGLAPRRLFVMVDRIERLRITRWQWCSMVILLMMVRLQHGQPMVAEVTLLVQFILFFIFPSEKVVSRAGMSQRPLPGA